VAGLVRAPHRPRVGDVIAPRIIFSPPVITRPVQVIVRPTPYRRRPGHVVAVRPALGAVPPPVAAISFRAFTDTPHEAVFTDSPAEQQFTDTASESGFTDTPSEKDFSDTPSGRNFTGNAPN
jgi:hypothetical protein